MAREMYAMSSAGVLCCVVRCMRKNGKRGKQKRFLECSIFRSHLSNKNENWRALGHAFGEIKKSESHRVTTMETCGRGNISSQILMNVTFGRGGGEYLKRYNTCFIV